MRRHSLKMVIIGSLLVILSLAMMFQPLFTWALEQNDLRGCAFEVDPNEYLFRLGNMNPGDTHQGTVTITKTGPSAGDIYFSLIHIDSDPLYPDEDFNLFEQLVLIIKQGDQVLYEGPMVGGASPGDPLLFENFEYLVSMVQGDIVLLDFFIILPGSTTGNEYQGASLETELILVSVCNGVPVPASLGDYVWIDANGNGLQDAGEVGLNGVTVRLLDAGGNIIATTVTANDGSGNPGYYLFNNLAPGTYSVQFVLPAGYSFTVRNADGQGITGPLNSDADPATGITAQVTLAAGAAVRYVDAGLIPPVAQPASLGDYVWIDANGNGLQDLGEVGLNGVIVYLLNAGGNIIATTVTANDGFGNPGYYLFNNLAPGTYSVQFVLPAGYGFTIRNADGQGLAGPLNSDADPATGRTAQVILAAGAAVRYIDAGLIQLPVQRPAINIEKATNGVDSDTPPGRPIPVGNTVTWTYVVTNIGNVPLRNIVVTDNRAGVYPVYISGDTNGDGVLQVGEIWTYRATGVAIAGQYANLGTVVGTPPTGPNVTDNDPSHYYGITTDVPGINIEKHTNGVDADTPTGPYIPAGNIVTWTYYVTNTGTVLLGNVVVMDNRAGVNPVYIIGDINGNGLLDVGETWLFRAIGIAVAGQYSNIGTVVGTPPTGPNITDSDPSHYFGTTADVPLINIEKTTNGVDADLPTGPVVLVGSTVTWTYLVTNPGNVPLRNITVTDNRGVVPVYISGDANGNGLLDAGETWIYQVTGVATAGQYSNIGTVVGNPPTGPNVTDNDPSHYFGVTPPPSEEDVEPEKPDVEPERPPIVIVRPEGPKVSPPLPRTDGISMSIFLIGFVFIAVGMLLKKGAEDKKGRSMQI